MKKQLTIIALLVFCCSKAQVNIGGIPYSWKNNFKTESEIPVFSTNSLNLQQLEAEDKQDEENGVPPRFGFKHEVNLTLENSGVWTELDNGDKLWQLEIYCPNAKSINFTFDKFWLPENGKLYIYGKDEQHYIGGFTNLNNKGTKESVRGFGTGLVYSDRVVLEYHQSKNDEDAIISLNGIVHGYRYIAKFWENNESNKTDAFGGSGSCQVNVNCSPEGDDWQDEKTGVALILVEGFRLCTGSLINNSCNNGELYFLTANHCLDIDGDGTINFDANGNTNLSSFSFLWNYEAPNCSNPSSEPSLYSTSGATLKANNSSSDFALFELDESPLDLNPQQKIMFNGWSRTTSPPQGGTGIHHPSGDVKKIATHSMTPVAGQVFTSSTHWRVLWDATTNGHSVTEGGSSGSPLFTNDGLIIGQLHGGSSVNCNNPSNDPGEYGRFSVSWDANSDTLRQLKHWLDNCGVVSDLIGGYYDNCRALVTVDYLLSNTTLVQASNKIEGSSIVSSTSSVEFKAGQEVVLKPGFQAQTGSNFLAHINPCTPMFIPVASKTNNSEIESFNIGNSNFPSFEIYPNPTQNLINVYFKLTENEEVHLFVTDLSGRQYAVYKNKHDKHTAYSTQIDVSDLSAGTYFITLITNNYKETKKIVKQ